jgi:hypothetical protein
VQLIWFESAVVARANPAELVVIALMDGERDGTRRCVAMLNCTLETACALRSAIGSALNAQP